MTPERPTRRWAPRLLLLVVSSVASLALAEGWARATYRPALELSGEFLGARAYPHQLNGAGFREDYLGADVLRDSTRRVLFLGDSFTFGSGVDDPALRFTDRIEAKLGGGVHLYNAGIPGSNPVVWARLLPKLLRSYRPEAVVAVFFLRDGTGMGTSMHFHRDRIERIRAESCHPTLAEYSRLGRWICDLRVQRAFTEWYLGAFRSAFLGAESERRVWIRMQEKLLELRARSAEAGASFHLVVFPLLFGLADYPLRDVEAEILRFATENDIPAVSLLGGFEGRDERGLWVSPVDQHPNAEGHRIAAETLLPYLERILEE